MCILGIGLMVDAIQIYKRSVTGLKSMSMLHCDCICHRPNSHVVLK